MASISKEFCGECFDFDRLCTTCLGGLVKREQKEALSRLLEKKKIFWRGSCNSFWKEFNISKFSSLGRPSFLVIVS